MLNFSFTKESPVIENFVSLGLTKTIFTLMPGSHNWANQANRERGVKFSEPAKKHKTEQSEQGYARVNHLANHQSEVELSTPVFLYNFEHERASHTKPKIYAKPSKQSTQIAKQSNSIYKGIPFIWKVRVFRSVQIESRPNQVSTLKFAQN